MTLPNTNADNVGKALQNVEDLNELEDKAGALTHAHAFGGWRGA
jgi:hypothetical protein